MSKTPICYPQKIARWPCDLARDARVTYFASPSPGKAPLGKLLHHRNPYMTEATRLTNASPSRKHTRATRWLLNPLVNSSNSCHSCARMILLASSTLYPVSEQLALLHGPGDLLLLTNNVPRCLCLIKLCTDTVGESCLYYIRMGHPLHLKSRPPDLNQIT